MLSLLADTGQEVALLAKGTVAREIPLGSVLGPVLFNTRRALQRDLDRLNQWAKASCMRLRNVKCWILYLNHSNLTQPYRLGGRVESWKAAQQKQTWGP